MSTIFVMVLKNTYMCPKKTLHGQLTPPSLGGPIRRKTTPYKNDETC